MNSIRTYIDDIVQQLIDGRLFIPKTTTPPTTSTPPPTTTPTTTTLSPTTTTTTEPPEQLPIEVELLSAQDAGLIEVNATGTSSINRIKMRLTSNSDDTMEVTILPGTIFTSSAAGAQSMVVIEEKLVLLGPHETTDPFNVDAACANMELDAPEESNNLTPSMEAPPEDLTKLLNLPDFHEETYRVQQFAIWTITDNPERDGYIGIVTGFGIFGTGPSDEEIEKIRVLFIKAGVQNSKYKALG